MYHHLVADNRADERFYEIPIRLFQQQLDWLQRLNFKTINFRELLACLRAGKKPPHRSVIITFDDGFKSFFTLALPALRSRGMTATIFVPAGYIGRTNQWDEARGFPSRTVMTEEELREVVADGMEIGSHGWLHRNLKLASAEEAEEELVRSKKTLEEITSKPWRFSLTRMVSTRPRISSNCAKRDTRRLLRYFRMKIPLRRIRTQCGESMFIPPIMGSAFEGSFRGFILSIAPGVMARAPAVTYNPTTYTSGRDKFSERLV